MRTPPSIHRRPIRRLQLVVGAAALVLGAGACHCAANSYPNPTTTVAPPIPPTPSSAAGAHAPHGRTGTLVAVVARP